MFGYLRAASEAQSSPHGVPEAFTRKCSDIVGQRRKHKVVHSGSADDLFHKSISGLIVAIFRTTFKSTTTTITVEDNFNCEKLKN